MRLEYTAMKLPELHNVEKYRGLYVFDFGDHAGVGFTGEEVAELLESERFRDGKVYKIHRAYPDGQMELKGVPAQTFQLESGMFFYASERDVAECEFKALQHIAVRSAPPCRAKLHLAKYDDDKFATAVIYPAEYDDEVSRWLLDNGYRTAGEAIGGVGAVQNYYDADVEILERHQLFGSLQIESRTGDELLAAVKVAVQR